VENRGRREDLKIDRQISVTKLSDYADYAAVEKDPISCIRPVKLSRVCEICATWYELWTRFVLFVQLRMTARERYVVSVDKHVFYLRSYLKRIAVSDNQVRDFTRLN
jgi:hypothetical protein